jgi:hypothetical protein
MNMNASVDIATLRDITEGELRNVRKVGNIVSIYDVIRAVTGHDLVVIRNTWKRLIETHPELVSVCYSYKFNKCGRGSHQETPATDAKGIIKILMCIPGNAAAGFRERAAETVVRYLGGDQTLIGEIYRNRAAQEHLAASNPHHPATLFGEAVESSHTPSETVEEQTQRIRKLRLENDRLEAQNLSHFMQVLTSIGEEIDDAQRWSVRDRMSILFRGDDNSQQQETTHASQFLLNKGLSPALIKRVRVLFGKIAAKLKRRRYHMPSDAKLPTKLKEVDGHPAYVVIYEVPQDLEILEDAYQELIESRLYDEAISSQPKHKGQTPLRF